MNQNEALSALGAMAHEGRLNLFRLLIQEGPQGSPVGELATAAGLKFGTASAQLAILEQANLVSTRREGRSIFYQPEFSTVIALVTYLMKDCCSGSDSRIAACCELLECGLSNQ